MVEKKKFKPGFSALFGMLLLLASNSALAFTLIEIPDPSNTPGNTITDATSFDSLIQPLIGAIQGHLLDVRRFAREAGITAQQGNVLASNAYAGSMVDAEFIQVSGHGSNRITRSAWLGTTATSFENDFSRTAYDGYSNLLVGGVDYTFSDKYILGVALSYEIGKINTDFNVGNQDISGYSINPYFAYLISDTWSVDLSLGLGRFDTEQTRATGTIDPGPPVAIIADVIDSEFSTDRDFIASSLTWSAPRGNWYLSGWLGLLMATKDQESYTESDDTEIDGDELDFKRWSVGGEAAYGHDSSETYFGLIYEKDTDVNEIEFPFGEQPSNDDDSALLTVGWRYFGSGIVANIELSSRQGADDMSETSISTTLRVDL